MNYLKIIIHFEDNAQHQEGFKSHHHSLFGAIVRLINKNNWNRTKIDLGQILYSAGLSKPTYIEARKWLVKNNWIEVVEGKNAYQMAEFFLGVEVRIEDKVEDNIFTSTNTSTQPSTNTSTLPIYNKPISYKAEKEYNTSDEKKSQDFVPSFVEADRQKTKESFISSAHLFEQIKKLGDDLKSDRLACERLCMSSGAVEISDLHKLIDIFCDKLVVLGEPKNRVSFRSYFSNWLPLNLDKVVPKKVERKMVY